MHVHNPSDSNIMGGHWSPTILHFYFITSQLLNLNCLFYYLCKGPNCPQFPVADCMFSGTCPDTRSSCAVAMAQSVGCCNASTTSGRTLSVRVQLVPLCPWVLVMTWPEFCAGDLDIPVVKTQSISWRMSSMQKKFGWTGGQLCSTLMRKLRRNCLSQIQQEVCSKWLRTLFAFFINLRQNSKMCFKIMSIL